MLKTWKHSREAVLVHSEPGRVAPASSRAGAHAFAFHMDHAVDQYNRIGHDDRSA